MTPIYTGSCAKSIKGLCNLNEPDGGRKWLMAYAPTGAKGESIWMCKYDIIDHALVKYLDLWH